MSRASSHSSLVSPSHWMVRALERMGSGAGKTALDLACGGGRHSRLLVRHGYEVLAVDQTEPTEPLGESVRFKAMDLEQNVWPLAGQQFDVVLVSNYLYRPFFDEMLDCLKPNGALIYETFMQGNELHGRPRSPDFLLEPGELLKRCEALHILGFEQGFRVEPSPAVIQRIVAVSGNWSEIQSLSNL